MSAWKSDKELADELDARDRLLERGYKQEKCGLCEGLGFLRTANSMICPRCGGRGYNWEGPITK